MSGDIHIHFNSTFRNRSINPNRFQFSIEYANNESDPTPTGIPILFGKFNYNLSTIETISWKKLPFPYELAYNNSFINCQFVVVEDSSNIGKEATIGTTSISNYFTYGYGYSDNEATIRFKNPLILDCATPNPIVVDASLTTSDGIDNDVTQQIQEIMQRQGGDIGLGSKMTPYYLVPKGNATNNVIASLYDGSSIQISTNFSKINKTSLGAQTAYFFIRQSNNVIKKTLTKISDYVAELNVTESDGYFSRWWLTIVNIDDFASSKGPFVTQIINNIGNKITVSYELPTCSNSYCELIKPDRFNYKPALLPGIQLHEGVFLTRLLLLTVPDRIITNNQGGQFRNRSHLFVTIGNSQRTADGGHLVTNNKTNNSFAIPIDDMKAKYGYLFYNMRNCEVEVPIRLDLWQPLWISIEFPDGSICQVEDDFSSPYQPDPVGQVTATFRLKRIS